MPTPHTTTTKRAPSPHRDHRTVLAIRTYLDQQQRGHATHVEIKALRMILDRA